MVTFSFLAALGLAAASAAAWPQQLTYKDASLPVEERISDLLSRMTIEEKTAQLIQGATSLRYAHPLCALVAREHCTDSAIKQVTL